MKCILTLTLSLLMSSLFGQIKPGFNIDEVKHTIAMCNSYNFIKNYGTTEAIVSKEFNLAYTSDILSMDNKFQVFENGKLGIINYRGSTDKAISWVENCYSAMIPAKGRIKIDERFYEYNFSKSENAAVHAGYALSVVLISEAIIEQINNLNDKGIYSILITGHSQGGALATMTRAYLEHLPKGAIHKKNSFKTYAFAQPMCGNKEFAKNYNAMFSKKQTSYSIINPKDPVPYLPFNYEEGKLVTKTKLKSWIFGESSFSLKKFGQDAFIRTFEKALTKHVKYSNVLINKAISLKFGKIEMPEYVSDINYYPTGFIKEISTFNFPNIEVDITGLTEKEISNLDQRIDGKWYKKEKSFFQHKPYNYYVHVLKEWDPISYNELEELYLLTDI